LPIAIVYTNVNDDLIIAFEKVKYHPERRLSDDIWRSIEIRQKRSSIIKLYSYAGLGFISLIGLIPATINLLGQFSRSGFYNYFSLIFSSDGYLNIYWKELALSVINSLPVISLMFSSLLIFILFISLKYAIQQFKFKGQLLTI
jgi:hypothetical protein